MRKVYKHVYGEFTKDEKENASTKTPFVVKHRKDMVTDLEKCCMTNVVNLATSQPSEETSGAFPFTVKLSLQLFWS